MADDKSAPAPATSTNESQQAQEEEDQQPRFSPEEEASLVAESNANKTEANALFASSKYNAALTKYDEAVAACPTYLEYELAVLRSNIAACHLQLGEWKEAVSSATAALDGLDRLEREDAAAEKGVNEQDKNKSETGCTPKENDDEVEEEVVSYGASRAAPAPPREDDVAALALQKRRDDIARIRAKALMRRGRARAELGGWSNLEGAVEDYKKLAGMSSLGASDRRIVQAQLRALPPRAKAAQEQETAEMWGKLKELGNGILKPFGLSTENFKMVKDEKTGGYSMSFEGGGGGGGKDS